jgi:hypothetical protein
MRNPTILLCALAGLASAATAGLGGQTTVLDLTGNANIPAVLDTFVGSDARSITDAEVIGTLSLSSTDFSTLPGDLQLVDLDLMFVPAAEAMFSVEADKFLGNAEGALSLSGVSFDGDLPMPIGESGVATFSFPAMLTGDATATYNLIGIEPQTDNMFDLAGATPVNASLDIFTLQSLAGTLTVEATLIIETVSVPFEPGLVEIRFSGNINLSATGEDPTADVDFCSRADIAEPCGSLDLNDITAFVSGFVAMEPAGDFTGEGTFDLNDIVGFVTAFTSDVCDPAGTYYCYNYGGAYAAIEFDKGNAAYALGDHSMLTAGIAVTGCALMLGFTSIRRKHA